MNLDYKKSILEYKKSEDNLSIDRLRNLANSYILTNNLEEAIGIYEVETDSTNRKDEKWYINTNESYAFASFGFNSMYFSINGNPLL